jgi:oligoribonuclease
MTTHSPSTENGLLVFCDLETTGLDPEQHEVLEIALVVADQGLREVASLSMFVGNEDGSVGPVLPSAQAMHEASGFWTEWRAGPRTNAARAGTYCWSWLLARGVQPGAVLAGNSIHFDRGFIRRHMPDLEAFLHYRMVDVSSIRELLRLWLSPEDQERLSNERHELLGESKHRALPDARSSIRELAFYRERFFTL